MSNFKISDENFKIECVAVRGLFKFRAGTKLKWPDFVYYRRDGRVAKMRKGKQQIGQIYSPDPNKIFKKGSFVTINVFNPDAKPVFPIQMELPE